MHVFYFCSKQNMYWIPNCGDCEQEIVRLKKRLSALMWRFQYVWNDYICRTTSMMICEIRRQKNIFYVKHMCCNRIEPVIKVHLMHIAAIKTFSISIEK